MSKVIVCANQKGGVAKTTTTVNLGIGLARKGMRVLVIDNDPQASLTISLGFQNPERLKYTTGTALDHVMDGDEFDPREGILHHHEGVDLLPSNASLNATEHKLQDTLNRETRMRKFIEMIDEDYDFILIDCSPNLGMLTLNALAAAKEVIIPVHPSYIDIKGLELLLRTIAAIRREINEKLQIKGILLTMVDYRTNNAKGVIDLLERSYGGKINIFENMIPESVRAMEAAPRGISLFEHDPKGNVTAAYDALTWEVMA